MPTVREREQTVPANDLTLGVAAPPPVGKKVAIVGFASHWKKAPFNEPDYEIWTLNEFYSVAPNELQLPLQQNRVRWFELHERYGRYDGNPFGSREGNHAERLKELPCPVYMMRHWDDIPNSLEYPLGPMTELFGDYWTNTISFMLALAIAEGFQRIEVYGVDMAQDSEYEYQRPSCEYIIGFARGRGIQVYFPPESDLLFTTHIYGYQSEVAFRQKAKLRARIDELQGRWNHNMQQEQGIHDARMQIGGAIEDTRYWLRMFNADASKKGG